MRARNSKVAYLVGSAAPAIGRVGYHPAKSGSQQYEAIVKARDSDVSSPLNIIRVVSTEKLYNTTHQTT